MTPQVNTASRLILCLLLCTLLCLGLACCAPADPLANLEALAGAANPESALSPKGLSRTGQAPPGQAGEARLVDLPDGSVLLPPGWSPGGSKTWPVVVILHGYSRNSYGMSRDGIWASLSEEHAAVLIFPRSDGAGWDEAPDSKDRMRVTAILESLGTKPWVQGGTRVLFGWSAGSVLASDLLASNTGRNGNPLADRIVLYSGFMGYWLERTVADNPALAGLKRVPVLLICGRKEGQDDLIRMENLLNATGFDYRTLHHPDAHNLRDDMVTTAFAWIKGILPHGQAFQL